jgi:hypothetical protein
MSALAGLLKPDDQMHHRQREAGGCNHRPNDGDPAHKTHVSAIRWPAFHVPADIASEAGVKTGWTVLLTIGCRAFCEGMICMLL